MKISKRKLKRIILCVTLLAIGGLGWLLYSYWRAENAVADAAENVAATQLDRTFTVKSGELVLGITQPGTVTASKKYSIKPEANTRTTIVWIIEENTKVKSGDVLVRLDATALENAIADGKIELENLQKEQELAIESQKIEESTQAANMKSAEDRVTKADDALRKYLRYEKRQKRDALDLAITGSDDKLDTAKNNLRSLKNNPETDTDEAKQKEYDKKIINAATAISSAENERTNSENARRVWKRYDDPSKLKALYNEVAQADLNMQKVRVAIESSRNRTNRQINNYRMRIRRTVETLEQNQKFLGMMTITAPVDGVVIYGNPDRPWSNPDIKPGMDVWRGLVLMTIPAMSDLIVSVDLPEQYRSKVKVGAKVIVTPDSLPNLKFTGVIENIPTLPVNIIFYDSGSPKVYKSRIRLDRQSDLLVNGMSVQVEVITRKLQKVLSVPVEAVFEDKERFYVYRRTALGGHEEANVKIGASNDRSVEIISGLKDGDVIFLYRPYPAKNQ